MIELVQNVRMKQYDEEELIDLFDELDKIKNTDFTKEKKYTFTME